MKRRGNYPGPKWTPSAKKHFDHGFTVMSRLGRTQMFFYAVQCSGGRVFVPKGRKHAIVKTKAAARKVRAAANRAGLNGCKIVRA